MHKYLQNGAAEIARQIQRLDVIANNLANMNTNGYKGQNIAFCDLVNENNLGESTLTESVPKIARTSRDFSQGIITKSENPLSVAIQGKGFFKLIDDEENEYFTRDGNFQQDSEGRLIGPSGYNLEGVNIPVDTEKVYIRIDGTVECRTFQGDVVNAGQINLYSFNSPQELKAIGGNLFTANELSGEAQEINPGESDVTELMQGFVEVSNTDWAMEMMNIIQTQRTIQINSQSVIKTADQLWEMANNLRR